MPQAVILYTTWPDAEKAEAVGAEAVAERLAACANVFAPIRSIYRWQGAIERAAEVPMTLKTSAETAEALRDFLLARHPYDLPCVLALRTDSELSHPDFVAWVADETTPASV
jgi:periplasmic divalent cation tolerance protein